MGKTINKSLPDGIGNKNKNNWSARRHWSEKSQDISCGRQNYFWPEFNHLGNSGSDIGCVTCYYVDVYRSVTAISPTKLLKCIPKSFNTALCVWIVFG